jgi:hypothetical protein
VSLALLARAALHGAAAMAVAGDAAQGVSVAFGLAGRRMVPSFTVVGPGADKAGSVYASIATRLIGGVGDSAADAAAVATYLSIFTIDNSRLSLPGYGIGVLLESLGMLSGSATPAALVGGSAGLTGGSAGLRGRNPGLAGGDPGLSGGSLNQVVTLLRESGDPRAAQLLGVLAAHGLA